MTNFDYLFLYDKQALVDLLMCRSEELTCGVCSFKKYGFCPTCTWGVEYDTVNWLGAWKEL